MLGFAPLDWCGQCITTLENVVQESFGKIQFVSLMETLAACVSDFDPTCGDPVLWDIVAASLKIFVVVERAMFRFIRCVVELLAGSLIARSLTNHFTHLSRLVILTNHTRARIVPITFQA
jgi:hypothetical protein